MKKLQLFGLLFFIVMYSFAQNSTEDRKDRITASYLLAFGVLPQDHEMNYWINDPLSSKSLTELLDEHKKNIKNQQDLADRAIRHSYFDAFGRAPRQDEFVTWRPLKLSYTDLMGRHLQYLKEYPGAFTDVIKLSYRKSFNREAKPEEVNNWKSWGVRSYLAISQEHQKNIKAGMFAVSSSQTPKIKSSKESGVQFQPSTKIRTEIASAGGSVIATGGGNVIATGGGNVIATGGGNVIATGGGN